MVVRTIRPSFKKKLFLVERPGEYITTDWKPFFGHFWHFFEGAKLSLFSYQKKEEKTCRGRPSGHNFGPALDRKQTFLRVALVAMGLQHGGSLLLVFRGL